MRKSPYLPNLRRILARIIDPATGASTWALGSHRCIVYIGILIRKASVIATAMNVETFDSMGWQKNMSEKDWRYFIMIQARSGKDAVIVYNIKYIPASNRSGW